MCLNKDNSDQAVWYKKIKAKMGRLIFQRKLHQTGDAQNKRETELFLVHVRALCRALARANTQEGARRKFGIKTLWAVCGRGMEPGLLSLEGMRWNELFECVAIESAQSKPSKLKFALFMAGVDHLSDWVLDFADMLVWERGNREYSADLKTWLLPELYKSSSSSTSLTEWIKALQPGKLPGALQRYSHVAITRDQDGVELPPQPTAKGFRHGACDTICIGVPAELAVHNTGHDLTSSHGALFEYLNSRDPLCVPGALLLFGWPGIPYGQIGDGSKFPSLQTLVHGGVSMERLESLIDILFALHDASPPMLLIDGPLRPLMHAALATEIMYYEIRFNGSESAYVLDRMRDSYDKVMATPGHAAHSVFIEWGTAIYHQFVLDNNHLRDRSRHEMSEQMVTAQKGLGATMGRMHAQISDLAQRVIGVEEQNRLILQQNTQLLQLLQQQLTQQQLTQQPPTPGNQSVQPPPAAPPAAPATPAITPLSGSPSARSFMHATATASAAGASSATQPRPRDLGGQAKYELKDLQASRFLLDCMNPTVGGGHVPALEEARRKPEADGVLKALKAMCTAEEVQVLCMRDPDPAQQAHAVSIAGAVVKLLVQRLLKEYARTNNSKKAGRLATGTVLVNTLDRHLKQSGLNVSSSAFASWRANPSADIAGPMLGMIGSKRKQPEQVVLDSDDSERSGESDSN